MVEVRWTLQAADDLETIAKFIAKDSCHYARLFVLEAFKSINQIAAFPYSGRVVPELADPSIRENILGNYRIVYRFRKGAVEILTIYHGARLLSSNLKQR